MDARRAHIFLKDLCKLPKKLFHLTLGLTCLILSTPRAPNLSTWNRIDRSTIGHIDDEIVGACRRSDGRRHLHAIGIGRRCQAASDFTDSLGRRCCLSVVCAIDF